jgi:hypothetical protein
MQSEFAESEELTSVDIRLVRHIKDNRLMAIPSNHLDDANIIYKTFDLRLSKTPDEVFFRAYAKL